MINNRRRHSIFSIVAEAYVAERRRQGGPTSPTDWHEIISGLYTLHNAVEYAEGCVVANDVDGYYDNWCLTEGIGHWLSDIPLPDELSDNPKARPVNTLAPSPLAVSTEWEEKADAAQKEAFEAWRADKKMEELDKAYVAAGLPTPPRAEKPRKK